MDQLKKAISDWTKVSPPSEQRIVRYETLSGRPTDALSKLAILKVNGGLGTSMGMSPF